MPFISKRHPGSDTFGHVWDSDGAVVEVTDDEAAALLKIHDAHFALADPPEDPKSRKNTDK